MRRRQRIAALRLHLTVAGAFFVLGTTRQGAEMFTVTIHIGTQRLVGDALALWKTLVHRGVWN